MSVFAGVFSVRSHSVRQLQEREFRWHHRGGGSAVQTQVPGGTGRGEDPLHPEARPRNIRLRRAPQLRVEGDRVFQHPAKV